MISVCSTRDADLGHSIAGTPTTESCTDADFRMRTSATTALHELQSIAIAMAARAAEERSKAVCADQDAAR